MNIIIAKCRLKGNISNGKNAVVLCAKAKQNISILGVSSRRYTDEQLKQWKEANHRGCKIDGQHYTTYQASQLMRKLETKVRQQKDIANLAKISGDDVLRHEAQAKIRDLKKKYYEVAEASGLRERLDKMVVGSYKGGEKQSAILQNSGYSAQDARDDLKSIDFSAKIKIKQGFSAFPKGEKISENIKLVSPYNNYYDVALHGSQTAVGFGTRTVNMSPRLLAQIIKRQKDYTGNSIRLISCNTGAPMGDRSQYCFAEELANALGVEVIAPNDLVFIHEDGKLTIGVDGSGYFIKYIPNGKRRIKVGE